MGSLQQFNRQYFEAWEKSPKRPWEKLEWWVRPSGIWATRPIDRANCWFWPGHRLLSADSWAHWILFIFQPSLLSKSFVFHFHDRLVGSSCLFLSVAKPFVKSTTRPDLFSLVCTLDIFSQRKKICLIIYDALIDLEIK